MPFNQNDLPKWDSVGTEPPDSKKTNGYGAGDKPPADWFNWFFNRTYKALQNLFSNAQNKEEKGKANGYAALDANGKVINADGTQAGGVQSINNKTGIVTLNASDVGAETPSGAQKKVDDAIAALINGSPGALDTLKELADALGDDPNFASTIINRLTMDEQNISTNTQDIKSHKADYVKHEGTATTTNTGNAYLVTLNPAPTSYLANMGIVLTINADSTGAATLNVNGLGARKIKKANGNDVTNLKANGIYTVRYNPSADSGNGAFILQGEGGSGNAQPSDLRQGKTASTDTGDITGTLSVQATGAQTITPGTSDIVKPAGIYDGAITIKGDANLIAANIKKGTSIFGVTGSGLAYNSGQSVTGDQVKADSTKGNGKPIFSVSNNGGDRIGVTKSYMFITGNKTMYYQKADGSGAYSTYKNDPDGKFSDVTADDNNMAYASQSNYSTNGLFYCNDVGSVIWSLTSDSGGYYYTSGKAVDMDDTSIVYATNWSGASALSMHKLSRTGGKMWSRMGPNGAGYNYNSVCNRGSKGAAGLWNSGSNYYCDIIDNNGNLVGSYQSTTYYNILDAIGCDKDGYVYFVEGSTNGNVCYLVKLDPTTLKAVKRVPLSGISVPNLNIRSIKVVGSYVYVMVAGIIFKFTQDLVNVGAYVQMDVNATNIGASSGLFVNAKGEAFALVDGKALKSDVNSYYTLA